MKNPMHEMARKASMGDTDAMEMIVITAPPGSMKGMDPVAFAKKLLQQLDTGAPPSMNMMPSDQDESDDYAPMGAEDASEASHETMEHDRILKVLARFDIPPDDAERIATAICANESETDED